MQSSDAGDPIASLSESAGSKTFVMHSRNAVTHNSKATDIVVMETSTETPVEEAGDGVTLLPKRTMGCVYPIMKNTIYSDEECDGEVQLSPLDFGGRFILYINGIFQYLVRYPRTLGLILTTVLVLLFFKYSQQLVVKSVQAALGQHPGLEPSEQLHRSVISFTRQMRGVETSARTLTWAYEREPIDPSDVSSVAGTSFLALMASSQLSFEANLLTYIIHELPAADNSGRKWGLFGCQNGGTGTAGVVCMVTDNSGVATAFNGTNTTQVVAVVEDAYVGTTIMEPLVASGELSAGSAAALAGMWSQASLVRDVLFDRTVRVISFLFPVSFDPVDGHCTAAAGIDINVELLASAVSVPTPNIEVIVADSSAHTSEGGQFVLDTFNKHLFWETNYGVTATPEPRVNAIATVILRHNRGTLMVNGSFYEGGLIYQSLTMMNRWALIASSPLVLSAAEVEAAFSALVSEYAHVTSLAANIYDGKCEADANAQRNSEFVQSIMYVEKAFGVRVNALYAAYALEGAERDSTSSASGGGGEQRQQWGACGCVHTSGGADHLCFYTGSEAVVTFFAGPSREPGDVVKSADFASTHRGKFVLETVMNISSEGTAAGYWTAPYYVFDDATGLEQVAMSYVLPFRFNPTTGAVAAVAVFDMVMDWLPSFLSRNTHVGTKGLVMIDRRGQGTFMGSRAARADHVYPAMGTPNATINGITQAVFAQGGSFDVPLSFSNKGMLINYQLIEPYWGVIEVMPADVALDRYLPTPAVNGATDALRLIPTGQTIELFLYVGGILAAYFLNLLILGCSSLGEENKGTENEERERGGEEGGGE